MSDSRIFLRLMLDSPVEYGALRCMLGMTGKPRTLCIIGGKIAVTLLDDPPPPKVA